MSPFPELRFHHFGLATRDPARTSEILKLAGYECGQPVFDPLQNVTLIWCEKAGSPAIEVVAPAASDGPLTRILATQASGFYHLCYEIAMGAEEAIDLMRKQGSRAVTVSRPQPAVLFSGRKVSFHVIQAFGLIELLEPAVRNERQAS